VLNGNRVRVKFEISCFFATGTTASEFEPKAGNACHGRWRNRQIPEPVHDANQRCVWGDDLRWQAGRYQTAKTARPEDSLSPALSPPPFCWCRGYMLTRMFAAALMVHLHKMIATKDAGGRW